MDSKIKAAAATYAIPRVLGAFRMRWLVFGAIAYYGLRYLNQRGILPKQTGAALDLVDKGIDMAKAKVGMTPAPSVQELATGLPH